MLLMLVITLAACSVEDTHNDKPDKIKENKDIQTETSKGAVNDNPHKQFDDVEAKLASIDGDTMIKIIGMTSPEAIAILGSTYEEIGTKNENKFCIDYENQNHELLTRVAGETTVEEILYVKGKVYGAGIGMTFNEIEKKLGSGNVYYYQQKDSETKELRDAYYILFYYFDDVVVEFEGGTSHWDVIPKISYTDKAGTMNIYSRKWFEGLKDSELVEYTLLKEIN